MVRASVAAPVLAAAMLCACVSTTDGKDRCSADALATFWTDSRDLVVNDGLMPGDAATLTLRPLGEVDFAVAPERMPAAGFAAIVPIRVADRGIYRLTLDKPAWVDLVTDGAIVPSTAHGKGEACSGVRKFVDFPIEAGAHIVQLSGATSGEMKLRLARVPITQP